MPKRIKVGLITAAGGAHLSAYFSALAQTDEVASVALSDPSEQSLPSARKTLGEKLSNVYRDHATMLATEKPVMALISLEAVKDNLAALGQHGRYQQVLRTCIGRALVDEEFLSASPCSGHGQCRLSDPRSAEQPRCQRQISLVDDQPTGEDLFQDFFLPDPLPF